MNGDICSFVRYSHSYQILRGQLQMNGEKSYFKFLKKE